MKDNDKIMAAVFSFFLGCILLIVLIVGYIAIFKHLDCVTRQECKEIVDSVLTEIYD